MNVPRPVQERVSFCDLRGRPVDVTTKAQVIAARLDLDNDKAVFLCRGGKAKVLYLQTESCLEDSPPLVRPVTIGEAKDFFNRAGFRIKARSAFPEA